MSSKLHGYVWDACAVNGVKGAKLMIMARLADYSSDEGICWPSVKTIARQIGSGRSTVITAIGELERDGWLTKKSRRKGQRNESNVYTLNVARLEAAARTAHSHSSESEPSEIEPSTPDSPNAERPVSEPSDSERTESSENQVSDSPDSGPDPSVNSKPDPSRNKTPLTPQVVDNSQTQTAGEIFDFLNLLTGAKTRPDLQAIKPILERLTDGYTADEIKLVIEYRIIQLRGKPDLGHMLSPNFLFSARDFGAYFSAATDWQKKREHQAARESAVEQQRIAPPPAGDVPEIDFDEVFDRLFVDGGAPENQAEKIAMAEAVKNGFGNGGQDQARKKWRVILSRACAKTAGDK